MKKFAASILILFSAQVYAEIPVILQDTSVKDFVTWYTEQTGESVIVSPGASANLTVYSPQTPKDSLPELFNAVIRSHGLEIQEGTPSVISKPAPEIVGPGEATEENLQEDLVTVVHPFQNVLADDIREFTSSFINYNNENRRFTKQPSVFVIRSLNALAVTTTEDQHSIFTDLLKHLDTSRPLIQLEAVIYEKSDSGGLEAGVSYGQTDRNQGLVGGFDTGSLDQLPGTGFTLGLINDMDLAMIIRALRTDVYSKILSTPQILVLSGEEGAISVGQNVPFLSSTTTANGQTTQSIERRDVGVSLKVRPFISQDGQIILSLQLTADSINQSVQATDIITNTRNLSTTVQVKSGDSITLGGLITTEEEERIRKIPVLGSIPFLGALFRTTTTQTTERELNIILRAVDPLSAQRAVPVARHAE